MRLLGIDPGLRSTGWGVIACDDGRLRHIANGAIQPKPSLADADRLAAQQIDATPRAADQHRLVGHRAIGTV